MSQLVSPVCLSEYVVVRSPCLRVGVLLGVDVLLEGGCDCFHIRCCIVQR